MAHEDWLSTMATIKTCAWENPPSQNPGSLFVGHFTVAFSYAVGGNRYAGKFYCSHEWGKDAEVPILYNPQNPVEILVCDEDESEFIPGLGCVLELLGAVIMRGP